MARVLLTWELGLGIGHLMNLRPIGQELIRRGHQVFAAIRDVSRAQELWVDTGIQWFPSPMAAPPHGRFPFDPPVCYAHMLGNIGFVSEQALGALFTRWNAIFDDLKPDLVVADHSPTVLFSLWDRPIPRANVGLAFFCPPDKFPLPSWPRPSDPRINQFAEDERHITDVANRVLQAHNRKRLQRLSQFFNEIDDVVLATYSEFDHFGPRPNMKYWGHWPYGATNQPEWPDGTGPRIYSYLNPSPELEPILKLLAERQWPTLVVPAGIPPGIQERYASHTLRFVKPLDLRSACQTCDTAITNAGHGTVATLLLSGKPCLMIPLSVEQLIFANAVVQTGAGRIWTKNLGNLANSVHETAQSNACRASVSRLASKYSELIPGNQIGGLVDRFEAIFKNS